MSSDRNHISDRISATLIGLAIGDAMAAPTEGLSAYEAEKKYHFIDGYYESIGRKPGETGIETAAALSMIKSILTSPPTEENIAKAFCSSQIKNPARQLFSKSIILGIYSSIIPNINLALLCKNCFKDISSIDDKVCAYSVSFVTKEFILNAEYLNSPYKLFDSGNSLLSNLVDNCRQLEIGRNSINVSVMLDFIRKKMLNSTYDIMKIRGILGDSESSIPTLGRIIYQVLRSPDEFTTICFSASHGGVSTLDSSIIGAMVGSYCGMSVIQREMKDLLIGGAEIESLSIDLIDHILENKKNDVQSSICVEDKENIVLVD